MVFRHPSEKYEWKSVGMITFPTEWKNKIQVPNHQPGCIIIINGRFSVAMLDYLPEGKPKIIYIQISSCYLTTAQLADRTAVFSQPCYKIWVAAIRQTPLRLEMSVGIKQEKILPRMFKHKGKLSSSSCEALGWPGYRKGVLENNLRAVNRPHALKDLGKGKPTQISSCYLTTAQLADRTAVFSQPCYKIWVAAIRQTPLRLEMSVGIKQEKDSATHV